MENTLRLLPHVVDIVKRAGQNGIARHQLRIRTRTTAAQLDACVRFLHDNGYLTIEQSKPNGLGAGRTITSYRSTSKNADGLPDAPPAEYLPKNDLGLPPIERHKYNTGRKCRWCEVPLPGQHAGRPRKFCSTRCRNEFNEAVRTQAGRAFMRAPKYWWHHVAYYLVAADLASRGTVFQPTGGSHEAQLVLQQHHASVLNVTIFMAATDDVEDRYDKPSDSNTIVAVVHPSGRIVYTPPFAAEPDLDPEPSTLPERSGPGR